MMLAYDSRTITKDVDAVVRPSREGMRLAHIVAQELELPDGWINDQVKMFAAPTEGMRPLPLDIRGLALTIPTASYLLAMKAMACRKPLPGYDGDVEDIRFLVRKIKIKSVSAVQQHIDQYYPDDVIPPADAALIETIIQEVRDEQA